MRTLLLPLTLLCFLLQACQHELPAMAQENEDTQEIAYPETPRQKAQIRDLDSLRMRLHRADKVMAYNFNDYNGNPAQVECEELYDAYSKKLCPSARNERLLTPEQVDQLIALACDSSTYTGRWNGTAGVCFIPHLGFGFFQHGGLLAQVSVCFICSGIRTRPYYKSDDLSSQGGERFRELALELELEIVDHQKLKH